MPSAGRQIQESPSSKWDDGCNVRFRPIDVDFQARIGSAFAHESKTFLIVWTGSSNPNLDMVLLQLLLVGFQSSNDADECRSNIGENSNTTANE